MTQQQRSVLSDRIIHGINAEFDNADEYMKPSNYRCCVHFYPKEGFFLYDDCFVDYDTILGMIKANVLKFTGIVDHQGEKMLRYDLTGIYLTGNAIKYLKKIKTYAK